jgi:dihydroflavonol-4-reductase
MADSALAAGVRLVHTSSASTVGFPPDGVVANEDYRCDDGSPSLGRAHPYAMTKRLGEVEVIRRTRRGLNAVVLNPGAVLAFGGDPATTWSGLPKKVLRHRILAVPPGGFAFVGIEQVVAAHIAALESGHAGQRYLVVGENITLGDLYRSMATALGVRRTVIGIPAGVVRAAAWTAWALSSATGLDRISETLHPLNLPLLTQRMAFDQAKATAELGVAPEPVKPSILELARAHRDSECIIRQRRRRKL